MKAPASRICRTDRGGGRELHRRGFTLIEMTISASLMVLVLASAYVCLNAGFSAQRLIDPRLEAVQGARVALTMMAADLRAACALSKEAEFVGMKRTLAGVEAGNLDFATHHYTPGRAGEGDYCQTSYYLDLDRATGGLVLWRRRNPRLALDPFSGGAREEILRGVRQLKFEYYDGYEWFDTWGDPDGRGKEQSSLRLQSNLSGLPEAVRITLAVAPGWRPAEGSPAPNPEASATETSPEAPSMSESTRVAVDDSAIVFQTVARLYLPRGDVGTADAGSGESGPASPGGSGGGGPGFFPGGGG